MKRYPKYKESGVEWLGEVPEHWGTVKLGHLLASPPCYGVLVPDFEQDGVPMLRITDMENGNADRASLNTISRALSDQYSRTIVEEGDVVLSVVGTIGEAFRVDKALAGVNLSRAVARIQLDQELAAAYLCWIFQSIQFRRYVDLICVGTAQRVLNMKDLSEFRLVNPKLAEQSAIAAFLDRETAKIDGLVGEQRRLIELLKEKRQAVISHAVTKGLNPHAKLKPSGIEWLGDVPEHWRVLSLGRVTLDRCDGPFGSGLKSEHYTDSGVRVIRLQNIRSDGFYGVDEAFIDLDYYQSELNGHDVMNGDVLIAGLGDDNNSVGRACVAPDGIEPAMVKADCFRFRLERDEADPAFVAVQLSAGAAADAGMLSSGSTRSRIPLSITATRRLALPPLGEQSRIVDFLRSQLARFDTLTAEAERAIGLLRERRTALISAAVTGKIDVRGLLNGETA